MNKAITITLSGQIFQMEEAAYDKLRAYLDGVRRNLAAGPDADEVLADIETSIAEKFGAKATAGAGVITLADVDSLITVMGEPEVFDQEEARDRDQTDTETGQTAKKLYRNPDDVIIAGVCSGLASYFGVETTLVRLLFAVSIFFGGAGVVLYILLWIIIPEAKTSSQKIAMQGRPVTLASIEETVKKNLSKIGSEKNRENLKSFGRRLIEFPFDLLRLLGRALGKLAAVIVPVIRIAAGLFIFLMAAFGFGLLTFVFMAAFLDVNGPYLVAGVSLAELLREPQFRLGLVAAYLFLLMPVLFVGQGAVSLLRKKNSFTLASVGVMFGVFMMAAITAGLVGLEYGPRLNDYAERSQAIVNKDLPIEGFQSIAAADNIQLTVTRGDSFSVKSSGAAESLDRLEAGVTEGVLHLSQAEWTGPICLFCNRWRPVNVTITLPALAAYDGEDTANADINGFSGEAFRLDLKDSSHASVAADYDKIEASVADASALELAGTAKQVNLKLKDMARAEFSGQAESLAAKLTDISRLEATAYPVTKADMELADSARAEINVNGPLNVRLLDVSRLSYLGTASTTVEMKNVSSRLIKLDPARLQENED